MLIQAAANEWKVPASECSAANSVITHKPSGRTTTFGKVAEAAAKLEPPKDIKLKDAKDWKIAGKGVKRLDTLDKLTGKQVYGIDIKMPGMLIATIRDCPVHDRQAQELRRRQGRRHAGREEGGAGRRYRRRRRRRHLLACPQGHRSPAGRVGPRRSRQGVERHASPSSSKTGLDAEQAFVGNKAGDAKADLGDAKRKIEAVYSFPYQNHATMEPMNSDRALYGRRMRGMGPDPERRGRARRGRRRNPACRSASATSTRCCAAAASAAAAGSTMCARRWQIAKQMPGTPVKLIWSREEDMTHCAYHPVTQAKLTAGVDADGNVTGFHMRISGQSISASLAPERLDASGMDPVVFQGLTPNSPEGNFGYQIPNLLIDHAMRNTHILAGFWRGVNVNHNAIYSECFIDEVAHALGQDPLAFRLKMLKPKHAAVLKAVGDKVGWGTPAPQGVYRGLAQYMAHGSYVAACAEVSVTAQGALTMHRIVAAIDPGVAVNPAQIERQMSGSFVYGLTALLYGECTVKDGAIEQTNFDTYQMLRLHEMPKVETIVMPSGGFWGGVGEPTISVAAPAVLNAIFAATGKRIRSVPLMHQGIRTA